MYETTFSEGVHTFGSKDCVYCGSRLKIFTFAWVYSLYPYLRVFRHGDVIILRRIYYMQTVWGYRRYRQLINGIASSRGNIFANRIANPLIVPLLTWSNLSSLFPI